MTVGELLIELGQRGVVLAADGDGLRVEAPKGVLTPELLEALRIEKPRLLRCLRQPQPITNDARCRVHCRYFTFAETLHGTCSWCEADPIELASWPGNRRTRRGNSGPDAG